MSTAPAPLLSEDLWIEILDRMAPILGDVSQKSVKWAMKKTRTPQLWPGTVVSIGARNTITINVDDGGRVVAKAIGMPPLTAGERVMVLSMPPNAVYCFSLFQVPTQGISVVTSTTRPTDPFAGQMIYETDTTKTMQYNGGTSTWRCIARLTGMDTWNAVVRHGTTIATLNNGAFTAEYNQIGNYTDVNYSLGWGSTSTANGGTGTLTFSLPTDIPVIDTVYNNPFPMLGYAQFLNAGVARTARLCVLYTDGASNYVAFGDMGFGQTLMSHNSPYTQVGSGNTIHAKLRYRWAT